jgi:hypothetical protein
LWVPAVLFPKERGYGLSVKIEFGYPFSGYARLDFTNCFASTYMCLEGYDGTEDCYCGAKLKVCDSCGDCKASLAKKQEELFFYFGTMTGRNALRAGFDGPTRMQQLLNDTDESIDMTMKIAGYTYKKVVSDFRKAIRESINIGWPVLARITDTGKGSFRVINGYDGDTLICPEPTGAQHKPDGSPSLDEIGEVYVITGKTLPVDMRECFKWIVRVMECNRDNAVWDDCIRHFDYWKDLAKADFGEIRRRFKRISDIMWYTFNCHNFAETFRRELFHRIEDTNLRDSLYRQIDMAYDSTHNTAWQVIALNDCRDWSKRRYHELEWGLRGSVINCLETLKRNDEIVLEAMKEAVHM